MGGYRWLPGWYATRLHAYPVDAPPPKTVVSAVRAVCGAYVYAEPQTDWAQRRVDRGIPRCKHCERMIARRREAPND